MKRNLFRNSIVVSVALSALLAGCGSTTASDNNGDNGNSGNKQTSISGKAVDGYLENAVVCLDLNEDGYCQAATEPITTTLDDGSFTLDIKPEHRENSNFDEAMLLVFGGVDVDTGKEFKGKLLAPNDGSALLNVSPITTLVAKKVQDALKTQRKLTRKELKERIKQARQKVADALEITEDEVGLDPVEHAKTKGDDKLIRKALKVQKSIEALVIAAGVSDAKQKEKLDEIYASLAESLDKLDGQKGIDKLFAKAAENQKFKDALKGKTPEQMIAIADKISENLDKAFDDIADGDDKLEKIAAITRDDFEKIKAGSESGDLDGAISGIVYVPDQNADWLKKYIEHDLLEIGIRPTEALVNKLKEVYKNEIRAGVLLRKADALKDNADAELKVVYQRILDYRAQLKQQKEAEEAKYSDEVKVDLKALLGGKTLYEIDTQVRQNDNQIPTFTYTIGSLTFDDTATSVVDQDGKTTTLEIDGNNITAVNDEQKGTITFKSQTEDAYAFYTEEGRVMRFFLDETKAEDAAKEMQQKFNENLPSVPTVEIPATQVEMPAGM